MEQLRKFARYFKPYKGTILLGILCILCSMSFGLFVPYMVGKAIDDLGAGITREKIIYYPLVILGINLMSGVFLFWQRRLLINTSRHIEFDMRRDFYASLIDQPLEYFQSNRVGDLMARATNDLGAIRQIVGPMILYSFQAIFALCISLPIMLNISVKLTLLLLIPMPLVSLTVKILGEQIHKRFEKIQEFFSDITARAQENLTGVRVVRAYAQEDAEIEQFQKLNRIYALKNLQLVKFGAAMRPLLYFFIGLGFVIIVAVGVPMAVNGEITAGDFTAFILYLQRMIWYLIAVGYVVNLYQRGTASLKRFNEILEAEPAIKDGPEAVEQPQVKGEVEFRDLTFAYNGKAVLRDINLVVEQGKTVALVGKTGSGKSTLVSLIPRLLDAPDGSVLVDGVPIRHYPIAQLRKAIGFVPQETFLFSDTLAANIGFGVDGEPLRRKDPEQADGGVADTGGEMTVERAAEIAGLANDVGEFPGGYEQIVGERGITLSGGQKQRTAIARAVMREPRILVLDDSLSAVDTYTEERILHNLRDVRSGRTTLIVSHRVSTIRDADLICVLQDGRIIERGTHDELIELDGEYARLYERQLLEEELEATDRMNEELPAFRYHPDPIKTGSIIQSENECRCCGRRRGFIYTGPVYAVEDLDDSICPWCIADGSAAEKFSAMFSDDLSLLDEGISDEIVSEVTTRTPGYTSWQEAHWESHCGDACEFHGDASSADLKEMDPESAARHSSEYGMDETEWKTLAENYSPGGDPAFYKFVCRHCGKAIYNTDCS